MPIMAIQVQDTESSILDRLTSDQAREQGFPFAQLNSSNVPADLVVR
jgi:hypothetical protein